MLNRIVVTIAIFASLSGAALAAGRPDARKMDCSQVQALINQDKAVVLATGQHTYDRYVANSRYCSMGDFGQLQLISTRDTSQCAVHHCTTNPMLPFGEW